MSIQPRNHVMLMDHLNGMTLEAVATKNNMSKQRVHQCIVRLLEQHHLSGNEPKEVIGLTLARRTAASRVIHESMHNPYGLTETPQGFYFMDLADEERQKQDIGILYSRS